MKFPQPAPERLRSFLLMYCHTDIGGAYRWNPANNSWIQLMNFLGYPNNEDSLSGTESIGLDAQDTNRLYLACGWLSSPNQLFIFINQGATFMRINSPFQIRANDAGRGTNWMTLSGSELTNAFVLPVDTANGSVFPRLRSP